jgi:hypothetical protein
MYEPKPLRSLEEIDEMERKESQAIEALEIFDHSVRCQKCSNAVPIVGKLTKINSDKITVTIHLN